MNRFGQKPNRYVSMQLDLNKHQIKKERLNKRGLIESEIEAQELDQEDEVDRDAETN